MTLRGLEENEKQNLKKIQSILMLPQNIHKKSLNINYTLEVIAAAKHLRTSFHKDIS